MKTRSCFVSNSSSSSFCIYGVELDSYDFKEKIIKLKPDLKDEDCIYELSESLDTSLEVHMPCDWDTIYIGRDWSSIQDDETGKQFKESVESEIKKLFGEDIKCSLQEEAYNN